MKKTLAFLMMIPSLANAEFFTGNQLLEKIQDREVWGKMQALGYIQGVADAYMNVSYCPPIGVTAGQINDMVKNHLESNPATRNRTADLIIRDVLKAAWPCQNRTPARAI